MHAPVTEPSRVTTAFIFPDAHALGEGMRPQHLYSVRFSADELWGEQAPSSDGVYLDLWDDYLDPA